MGEREADSRIIAEVAHETLLRAWPRLTEWLREEREFLVFKGEAERMERRWRGMGRVDEALLTGLDLARAEKWLPTRSEDFSEEVIDFVQDSIAANRSAKERQIYDVIRNSGSEAVLILGRLTEDKAVLNALREELRRRNYIPLMFDFEVPATRDITGTILLMAHMARFIIADLTDPSSIPYELATVVSTTPVPVQPILLSGSGEFAMMQDLRRKFHWVLATHRYDSQEQLIAELDEKVIAPAEATANDLRRRMRLVRNPT
jgi:hypothetical protein